MPKSAKKAKSKTKKTAVASRKLSQSKYKSFKMSKTIKQPKPALTGSFRLFWRSLMIIKKGWKLFGGISLIYLVMTIMLVKGLQISSGIVQLKPILDQVFKGAIAQVDSSVTLFTVLLGKANSSSGEAASVYQTFFFLIFSLAFIWALRRHLSDNKGKIRIRDAFYKGLYPLVPMLLVLLVIGLQLLPLIIANGLYGRVLVGGLAVTAIEKILWLVLIFLLALLSLYMVSSSIIALYIVTLPDVTPMQALRSARDLVRFRRWMIMRKIFVLPVIMIVLAAIIIIPMIIISPVLAEWLFLALTSLSLAVVHSYLYNLYRELL